MVKTDSGYAPARWAFDDKVTTVFDDMLARSIPQYLVMRDVVKQVGSGFIQPGTAIVDLGCSRGEALSSFEDISRERGCKLLGLEISEPMLAESRLRFARQVASGLVDVRSHDLREGLPEFSASLVLSVLTLMFVPVEYRQGLVQRLYDQLEPGGAFVLVEKVLGQSAGTNALMVEAYYAMKAENGYSQEDIDRKRLSLEGVLVPLTPQGNEELLRGAGFTDFDSVWRWMNFAAWVAIK